MGQQPGVAAGGRGFAQRSCAHKAAIPINKGAAAPFTPYNQIAIAITGALREAAGARAPSNHLRATSKLPNGHGGHARITQAVCPRIVP